MTAPAPAGGGRAGLVTLAWLAGAALAFYALFWLISLVLNLLPEPIGPRADLFVDGARITLLLTVVSGLAGLVIGMLVGLGRTSAWAPIRWLTGVYIWIIRGTPLLVQILFVYFALPQLFPPFNDLINALAQAPTPGLAEFMAAAIALALNVGAYNAEVIRAGIQAVPRGQTEAARSLGLNSWQTMSTVVLPQAFRIVVPPLVNNVIALLKDSSLASVIALVELTLAGQRVSSETFQPVPVLTTVAAVYLLLTTVLTLFTDVLERRLRTASR